MQRNRIARTPSGHRCGESHHRVVLTDAQVREIRTVYGEMKTNRTRKGYGAIAAIYGVGASTVRDICTYRTRINA